MSKDNNWSHAQSGSGGAVYCLGLIGALFYFLPQATDFGQFILGILKSIVWPGYFVYEIFQFLKI